VDDDCLPDRELLSGYGQAIKRQSNIRVFEGRTYPDRPRRSLAEACPTNETGGWLWSCNFAIRKDLFDLLRGFNERFPYACMEDVDFRDRLQACGEDFAFVSNAAVCHPWRPRKIDQELRQHEESVAIYLLLHPEKRDAIGSKYYLRIALAPFVKHTLPAIFQLRGAGLSCALAEHLGYLRLALKNLHKPAIKNAAARPDNKHAKA
jgi:GT2 family glycosyltransferase